MKGGFLLLTAKVGESTINCFDGKYDRYRLKQWSDKGILKCPVCGGDYEYCHGEVISPYFRHVGKECSVYYSEPETDEHRNGKLALYDWIKNQRNVTKCELEYWIPETKQRPDIYFEFNGKRFVIEYQCTPIASEFLLRKELYRLAGINDIWILGTSKYGLSFNGGYPNFKEKYKVIEIELKKNQLVYFDINRDLIIANSGVLPFDDDLKKSIININHSSLIKRFELFDQYRIHRDVLFTEKLENLIFKNDVIRPSDEITDIFNVVKECYREEYKRVLDARFLIRDKTKASEINSEYVGNVDDLVSVEVILLDKKTFKSMFSNMTTFYKFSDEEGNIYIWYTSTTKQIRVGEMVRLTGKVKSHSFYQGVKQTTMTRCKINE